MNTKEKLLVVWILVVVAIGFLFHQFLSWTVYAFSESRRVQLLRCRGW